jgi:hypothetical protein
MPAARTKTRTNRYSYSLFSRRISVNDRMRRWYGDTNQVIATVDSTQTIEIGDLLYQDVDTARPAAYLANQTSEAANQAAFAGSFLGVAMQRSRVGDSDPIRVATTGVFEFECAGDTFRLGDLVGPDQNATQNGLLNQQVVKVALPKQAIGRVARGEPVSTTRVLVDVRSTVMTGGVGGNKSEVNPRQTQTERMSDE